MSKKPCILCPEEYWTVTETVEWVDEEIHLRIYRRYPFKRLEDLIKYYRRRIRYFNRLIKSIEDEIRYIERYELPYAYGVSRWIALARLSALRRRRAGYLGAVSRLRKRLDELLRKREEVVAPYELYFPLTPLQRKYPNLSEIYYGDQLIYPPVPGYSRVSYNRLILLRRFIAENPELKPCNTYIFRIKVSVVKKVATGRRRFRAYVIIQENTKYYEATIYRRGRPRRQMVRRAYPSGAFQAFYEADVHIDPDTCEVIYDDLYYEVIEKIKEDFADECVEWFYTPVLPQEVTVGLSDEIPSQEYCGRGLHKSQIARTVKDVEGCLSRHGGICSPRRSWQHKLDEWIT